MAVVSIILPGDKAQEEKIRESEERLRLATDAAEMFSWENDLITKKIKWSDNAAKIIGCQPEELSEDTSNSDFFIAPEERDRNWQEYEKALAAGKVNFSIEFKGKEDKFWQTHCLIVRGEAGNPVKTIGVTQDITARKRIEQQLAEQRRLYKSITDNATTALFIMDENQQCTFMNRAAEKLTGFTFEETQGFTLHDLVHHTRPDGSPFPLAECPIDQAFPTRNQMQGEEVFVHKDGHFYDVFFTASPLLNDNGRAVGTVIEVQDITARKRIERKIQTANYRFRLAEEAAKGFNYEWDLETRKTTRSESIERVLGYPRKELKQTWQAWTDLIHPEDVIIKSEAEALEFLQNLEEDTFSGEYRVRHKDGHYIWVMERGLIIREENGNPCRIIGQTMDVTERKEQEELLRLSEERYRALVEASAQVVWTMDADGQSDSHRHWFAQLTGNRSKKSRAKATSNLSIPKP
ncbi:MAG: PAS domain S-box protein [Blastocatellia bacterium]|nr:PAS domain S-box protein [Blastocatellia bacterium]